MYYSPIHRRFYNTMALLILKIHILLIFNVEKNELSDGESFAVCDTLNLILLSELRTFVKVHYQLLISMSMMRSKMSCWELIYFCIY